MNQKGRSASAHRSTEVAEHGAGFLLLGVVALSGMLNRYSDTLAVVTDQESVDWAREFIAPVGWELGKHAGAKSEQRTAAPFGPRAFKSLVPGADH
jgi:hypothetical protein